MYAHVPLYLYSLNDLEDLDEWGTIRFVSALKISIGFLELRKIDISTIFYLFAVHANLFMIHYVNILNFYKSSDMRKAETNLIIPHSSKICPVVYSVPGNMKIHHGE